MARVKITWDYKNRRKGVARCVELDTVSQGKTIEDAQANLKEAVELYLESFGTEDLPETTGEVLFYPLEVPVSD